MKENSNPYAAPRFDSIPSTGPPSPQQISKRYLLLAIPAISAAKGIVDPWLPVDSNLPRRFELLFAILFVLLVYWWYDYDQRELGRRPSALSRIMMLICPGPCVMIPIHLLVTRGVNALKSIVLAAGYLVLVLLVQLSAFAVSELLLHWLNA